MRKSNRRYSRTLQHLWELIVDTHTVFNENECGVRAAGLAYHLLLSLLPLLLFLLYLGGQLLSTSVARASLQEYLQEVLPGAAPSITSVLDQVVRIRGTIGVLSGVLLLWSASSVFQVISAALNRIWGATPRPFWRRRLVAIALVLGLGMVFIGSIWLNTLAIWTTAVQAVVGSTALGIVAELVLTILFFWLVHRTLPNRKIPALAALAAAGLSGSMWQAVRYGYTWFLRSGLSNYGLVYGSLASVVILMLWVYLSGLSIYLGASFGVALERRLRSSD